jgi:predicted NBD/HSP70 family sugar kinase
MIKIGVDIGATNLRVGFIRVDTLLPVEYRSWQLSRGSKGPDIPAAVRTVCQYVLVRTPVLERKGFQVVRSIGVGAPGAYLKDGRVYPGTVPNVPALEKVKLYRLFVKGLGAGWRVGVDSVHNDGVLQGLVLADRYVKATGMRSGKIVAIVPGTGCGAGVYEVKGGKTRPVPGPQQLFDVVVRGAEKGEPLSSGGVAKGGEPVIANDAVSGKALERYGRFYLGRSVDGAELSRLALEGSAIARGIFRRVGADLAELIKTVRSGKFAKARVPFCPNTKSARVFLIGGRWMLEGAGRRWSLSTARRSAGRGVVIVAADRIPGLKDVWPNLGIAGASLVVKNGLRGV